MDNNLSIRKQVPGYWKWFTEGRYGLFIHWGPYAQYGKGEQVVFREHMDMGQYEKDACLWNPAHFDAKLWARTAKAAGMKYAVFTTRHHDGYCLWDTAFTDYSSAKQAPKRDFVREFVDAFRAEGLAIGLYYSWLDWRLPAFLEGPEKNPADWAVIKKYLYNQIEELLTNYGQIDYLWFDGTYPRAKDLADPEIYKTIKKLQPHILLNSSIADEKTASEEEAGQGLAAGHVIISENKITASPNQLWECCQVSTWRLWGYGAGERWRCAAQLLDTLCSCAVSGGYGGGNLLLNVGPNGDGEFPAEFVERIEEIGQWLAVHGEAVYDTDGGDVSEFLPHGYQTTNENKLYLIFRFWVGETVLRLPDILSNVKRVTFLTTGRELDFEKIGNDLFIKGLPKVSPTTLFPVIKIECDGKPEATEWGKQRIWGGDPQRVADWARGRGDGVFVGGKHHK